MPRSLLRSLGSIGPRQVLARAGLVIALGVTVAAGVSSSHGSRVRSGATGEASTHFDSDAASGERRDESVAAFASSADVRAPARLVNAAAYIPPQCYAETRGAAGGAARNGCQACHQASRAPNYVNDGDAQTTLSFARFATRNHWGNLLSPPPPAPLSDDATLAWVRADNYAPGGAITLASRLSAPPSAWDADGDGAWGGFVPDCHFRFDDDGFDRDAAGALTGWRAFAYAPMPGMFWPTNGSAGDAMIRLPEAYREDAEGRPSRAVYKVNLALVEAYVARRSVPLDPTDERALGVDLDGDGRLGTATRVAFVWPPRAERPRYVGRARDLDPGTEGLPAAGLFPRGTELLHSLRYLDVAEGKTRMAARMKELRYMRKTRFLSYAQLELAADKEAREKVRARDHLRWVMGDAERGVQNGVGWVLAGFIEDEGGELRPQTLEESAACIGCHGGVGVTSDSTFAFARKLAAGAFHGGWYHWGERGLTGIAEPLRADGAGEYARWLTDVGGGDDYGSNDEVRAAFFRDGALDPAMRRALAKEIATLLVPSAARALALDRAYVALVRAQSFAQGREVVVGEPPRIAREVVQDAATGVSEAAAPSWRAPPRGGERSIARRGRRDSR